MMKAFADSIKYLILIHDAEPGFSGRKVFTWSLSSLVVSFEQKTALAIMGAGCILEFVCYDKETQCQEPPSSAPPCRAPTGMSAWGKPAI